MKKTLLTGLLFVLIGTTTMFSQDLEKALAQLEGKFVGEWTSYKKNVSGEIEIAMTWRDTITTGPLVKEKTLAYVEVESTSTFDNPIIPPYTMKFKEGFYIDGGQVGKRFFNIMGAEILFTQLNEKTYAYTQDIQAGEFQQMRFFTAVEGTHTVIKVVNEIDGIETHSISRISTIISKDEEGKLYETQFISLKGVHRRVE